MRARVVVVILALAAACLAACGDDIRCYAPDESACGIPSPDASTDAPTDANGDAGKDANADADAHGADVGDAEIGEGG